MANARRVLTDSMLLLNVTIRIITCSYFSLVKRSRQAYPGDGQMPGHVIVSGSACPGVNVLPSMEKIHIHLSVRYQFARFFARFTNTQKMRECRRRLDEPLLVD